MGKTLVVFKIYPEEVEAVGKVEKAVKELKGVELRDMKREPIAFGLELIKAAFTLPEKEENALEELEKKLRAINGVNQIEVEMMTLV
ncbi:MAG: hypothetical protein V1494_02630 [Candidatus Diapherotrites archaeon]